MTKRALVPIIAFSLLCAAMVAMGTMEKTVDPAAVLEIWSDVVRDVDQFGLQLTRLTDHEEMLLGDAIADAVGFSQIAPTDPALSAYVSSVGGTLARQVRRKKILYRFQVVPSAQINAFALPGGHVYITRGMLDHIQSEAELAMILGHEIAHVDLRHCVELFQYGARLETIGAGPVGVAMDFARRPLTISYSKFQELEADAQGLAYAVGTGYDPRAAAAVMRRIAALMPQKTPRRPSTPLSEVARISQEMLSGYFRTHPLFPERLTALNVWSERDAKRLAGRVAYVGRENFRLRIPRSSREFSLERIQY